MAVGQNPTPAATPPPIVRMATCSDARIEQMLMVIGNQAGARIDALGKVPGSRVTLNERDVDLETLLTRIAEPRGWKWFKRPDGSYGLADKDWTDPGPTRLSTGRHPAADKIVRMAIFNDAAIGDVLKAVGAQTDTTIVALGKAADLRVTVSERDVSLVEILNRIAEPNGMVWFERGEKSYGIADRGWVETNGTEPPPPPPAPTPGPNGERIVRMASFKDVPIEKALIIVGQQVEIGITPMGKILDSRITIDERDVELETLLDRIAKPHGWVWFKQQDGNYGVADEAWYKANEFGVRPIQKILRPDHLPVEEVEKIVAPLVSPTRGSVYADSRTNKVIVMDDPPVLEAIADLVREFDVEPPGGDMAAHLAKMRERAATLATASQEQASPLSPEPARIARVWDGVPVEEFLRDVSEPFGAALEPQGTAVGAKVTHEANDVPSALVLGEVLARHGWLFVPTGEGSAVVCDPDWYESAMAPDGVRRAEYAPTARAVESLAAAMEGAQYFDAVMRVDREAGSLRIVGKVGRVEQLERLARELDFAVSDPPTPEQLLRECAALEKAWDAGRTARRAAEHFVQFQGAPRVVPAEAVPAVEPADGPTSPMTEERLKAREQRLREHEQRVRDIIEERRKARPAKEQGQPLS